MDIQSHIVRFRNNKRKHNRSNPLGKVGLIVAGFCSVTATILAILLVFRYSVITKSLPSPAMMEALLNPPKGSLLEPTKIYDQNGQTVLWRFENPTIEYRQNIRLTDGTILFYSDIPEELVNATLTAIDPDYFSKPNNLLGNLWYTSPEPVPETLVRELLLWDETSHPYWEIRINMLADQIVAEYGRAKVLEWYFNSAYYGNQIYGVDQASRFYFGKQVQTLDLSESALLAAVAKYPSLNPYDAPTAAKENQENILNDMLAAEIISPDEAMRAAQKVLIYSDPGDKLNIPAPAYVEYILEEAGEIIPPERLIRGGFRIISSLDSDLQSELECTAEVMSIRVYGEDPQLDEACQASRLLPKYSGPILSEEDRLEIDLVLLDPQEGHLLAIVDLRDKDEYSSVFGPKLPGSLVTPFIYLNSFTQGFEPASLVWDIPLPEDLFTMEELHPSCDQQCDYQGPVSIRSALANDYLTPAITLWNSFGHSKIENTLALFGFTIPGELCQECGYFPDSSRLEMIDIAQGYGVFANQGLLRGRPAGNSGLEIQPSSVLRIEDNSGKQWLDSSSQIEKRVISGQLASLINQVLSDEQARTNRKEKEVFLIGRPAGVKVGNVEEGFSNWVVGYTPQIVMAVWAGSPEESEFSSPPDYPQITSGLWRAITQYSTRDYEVLAWQIPEGMITLDVCYPSGMLPTENCPRAVREIFIQGNEPQQVDSLYQVLDVNRETGLLASVFTPSEQIEERVYLTIPPEAADWAEQAGLSTPPDVYDLEYLDSQQDGFIISYPDNFSFVHGQVSILGSIPGDEFVSSRLQFGKGMNPTSWLQIGSDILAPGDSIRLGLWDTEDLEDGLYALQLVLVQEQQQVEKTSLVVSVDNTSPEMSLSPDLNGQAIVYLEGKELLFQPIFENSSEIQKVFFYLNSDYQSSREVPPFVFSWTMIPGKFELRIVAVDQANNRGELVINFEIIQE